MGAEKKSRKYGEDIGPTTTYSRQECHRIRHKSNFLFFFPGDEDGFGQSVTVC